MPPGALQDGAKDHLEAIHVRLIEGLTEAAANRPLRIVQISAAGVTAETPKHFSQQGAARCPDH